MKNVSLFLIPAFAVAASILVLSMPMASAATIHLFVNGNEEDSLIVTPSKLINRQITVSHDPSDISWSKVKVGITVNSASLAHSIEKIFLYKCKALNPSQCVQAEPIIFDSFVDTELLWNDISQKVGGPTYPQTANLLTLVKLKDQEGQVAWLGFWDTVNRISYNAFETFNYELPDANLYVADTQFLNPTKNFISNFQMLPFNWAESVLFSGALSLFGIGADTNEIELPSFETAQPSSTTITAISKDFFFVFPKTTSGIGNPIVLNKNPSFTCGDGTCEGSLGEDATSCCYDCGCGLNAYCDIAGGDPETGSCKNPNDITMSVTSALVSPVTNCNQAVPVNVTVQINNPPASLPAQITALLSFGAKQFSVSCPKGIGNTYTCVTQLSSKVSCGLGSYIINSNKVSTTIPYTDGATTILKELTAVIPDITVNYDCSCPSGFFCNAGTKVCSSEATISLSVLSVTSFIPDYNPAGDTIDIVAKINNPPTDLSVTNVEYQLGKIIENKNETVGATTGSITCVGGAPNHVYNCSIPLFLPDYSKENTYFIQSNSITFKTSFSDGPITITKDLKSGFSDVTVPSSLCGDGLCDNQKGESAATCCVDCGCAGAGEYCDAITQCKLINDVGLTVLSVSPRNVSDCTQTHLINLTTQIINKPAESEILAVFYMKNGEPQPYPITCKEVVVGSPTGLLTCQLTLPPIPECSLPYETLGPNTLNLTISYPDGSYINPSGIIQQHLTASFADLILVPQYHPNNGVCEPQYGESAANSCVDCPCAKDPMYGDAYYCDYHRVDNIAGSCQEKGDIKLVVDHPNQPVSFKNCEIPHFVNIKAHIKNQPSGTQIENIFGTLDGESTQNIYCQQEVLVFGTSNLTLNCTAAIPADPECSKGDTNTYEPNDISVLISYNNGAQKRELLLLTDDYAAIKVRQTFTSLFDITQELIQDIQKKIQDILEISQKLISLQKFCLYASIAATALTIVGIGYAFYDALKPSEFQGQIAGNNDAAVHSGISKMTSKLGSREFKNTITAYTAAGTFVLTAIGSICNMLSAMMKSMIDAENIEIEFLKMEACLQVQQHQLDAGYCGKDLSCFNGMLACVNLGSVNGIIGNMQANMNVISAEAQKFGQAAGNFANAIESIQDLSDTTSLYAKCNDVPGATKCCGYGGDVGQQIVIGGSGGYTTLGRSKLSLFVSQYQSSVPCQNPMIQKEDGSLIPISEYKNIDAITAFEGESAKTFKLICNNEYVDSLTVCLCVGDPTSGCLKTGTADPKDECITAWGECGSSLPSGYGTVTATTAAEMINSAILAVGKAKQLASPKPVDAATALKAAQQTVNAAIEKTTKTSVKDKLNAVLPTMTEFIAFLEAGQAPPNADTTLQTVIDNLLAAKIEELSGTSGGGTSPGDSGTSSSSEPCNETSGDVCVPQFSLSPETFTFASEADSTNYRDIPFILTIDNFQTAHEYAVEIDCEKDNHGNTLLEPFQSQKIIEYVCSYPVNQAKTYTITVDVYDKTTDTFAAQPKEITVTFT
ncbi:MAG: hypothetical protein KKA90_03645 [Nanoarchaeota archaeon]|nr:hypothetical protein [Nanoarchaeota archaeon]